MFIAMNRFKIIKGKEEIFESIWKNRDSHLENVPGFKNFNLIKGKEEEEFVIYASHSTWESEKVSLLGQNLKHLKKHIKMLVNTEKFTLVTLNLKALM